LVDQRSLLVDLVAVDQRSLLVDLVALRALPGLGFGIF
jgi:hypothetical protein